VCEKLIPRARAPSPVPRVQAVKAAAALPEAAQQLAAAGASAPLCKTLLTPGQAATPTQLLAGSVLALLLERCGEAGGSAAAAAVAWQQLLPLVPQLLPADPKCSYIQACSPVWPALCSSSSPGVDKALGRGRGAAATQAAGAGGPASSPEALSVLQRHLTHCDVEVRAWRRAGREGRGA